MGPLLGIAHNTFTESIRQPVFLILVLVVTSLLVLNPSISQGSTLGSHGSDTFDKFMVDLGLSMMLISGMLLAAFTATGVVSREIERKTVLTVVSKPISRLVFLLGKFCGVLAAVWLAYWVWGLVFLLTVRHGVLESEAAKADIPVIVFGALAIGLALVVALWCNYFYRWVFGATFSVCMALLLTVAYGLVLLVDAKWQVQPPTTDLQPQLLLAMLLLGEALAVISAIALAASTRMAQVMTLVVCTMVFAVGLTSDYLFGRFAEGSLIARLAYALPLNIQFHWLADALTQGRAVSGEYIVLVTGYSVLYTGAVLCLAVVLFQTREVS